MCEEQKKRLTVLLCAGAMIEATGISTNSLTELLLKAGKSDDKYHRAHLLINDLYVALDKFHNGISLPSGRPVGNLGINFEHIIHAIEVLYTIKFSQTSECPCSKMPIYEMFFQNQVSTFMDYSLTEIKQAYELAINTISDEINRHENQDIPPWFLEFWKGLSDNFALDIISTNYDNWLEKIFNDKFVDGFDDKTNTRNDKDYNSIFQPEKIFDTNAEVTISHLHGNIRYKPSLPGRKNLGRKYNEHKRFKIESAEQTLTQSNDFIFSESPIISGLLKSNKILISPFSTYFAKMQQALLNNDALLIIGYSFNDQHINQMLKLSRHSSKFSNKNIVVIDYIKEYFAESMKNMLDEISLRNSNYFENLDEICKNDNFKQYTKRRIALWYNGFEKASEYLQTIIQQLCEN